MKKSIIFLAFAFFISITFTNVVLGREDLANEKKVVEEQAFIFTEKMIPGESSVKWNKKDTSCYRKNAKSQPHNWKCSVPGVYVGYFNQHTVIAETTCIYNDVNDVELMECSSIQTRIPSVK